MAFYDDMASMADELLTEFGEAITIVRPTRSATDPERPWLTELIEDTSSATALWLYEHVKDAEGELTANDSQTVYVSPTAQVEPSLGDILRRTTVAGDWPVLAVKPLRPAGTICLYEVQVGRAG